MLDYINSFVLPPITANSIHADVLSVICRQTPLKHLNDGDVFNTILYRYKCNKHDIKVLKAQQQVCFVQFLFLFFVFGLLGNI